MSTHKKHQHETENVADPLADQQKFKMVSVDGDMTVVNHSLKEMREDEEADERAKAFADGRLQRVTPFNFGH